MTSAPSAASRRAIAAPIPLAPPVTSALRPSSLIARELMSADWVRAVSDPIPIIGGTGALGYGLALRWARAGREIVIGSRKAERAEEAAAKVAEAVPGREGRGPRRTRTRRSAARSSSSTVPFRAQSETLNNLREALAEGQLLVDCTVPTAAAVSGKATRTRRRLAGLGGPAGAGDGPRRASR